MSLVWQTEPAIRPPRTTTQLKGQLRRTRYSYGSSDITAGSPGLAHQLHPSHRHGSSRGAVWHHDSQLRQPFSRLNTFAIYS
jgi:hypothetical protein